MHCIIELREQGVKEEKSARSERGKEIGRAELTEKKRLMLRFIGAKRTMERKRFDRASKAAYGTIELFELWNPFCIVPRIASGVIVS